MFKLLLLSIILSLFTACSPNAVEEKTDAEPLGEEVIAVKVEEELVDGEKSEKVQRNKLSRSEIESLLSKKNLEENLLKITKTHRKRGTEENYAVGDYIKSKMEEYGYDVEFQVFNAYEEEASNSMKAVSKESMEPEAKEPIFQGRNIIAKRKDFNPDTLFLVISAHYDTTTDNVGAMDNGGGVCALMEAARLLEKAELTYEPVFVFFDSEEYHLFGSRYYIYSLKGKERANLYGNFNIDMVGNASARKPMIVDDEDGEFYEKAKNIFPEKEIGLSNLGQSDDSSFYYNWIRNGRYTTADFRSEEFDKNWLVKEEDSSAVDLDSLVEDTKFISIFANEFILSSNKAIPRATSFYQDLIEKYYRNKDLKEENNIFEFFQMI